VCIGCAPIGLISLGLMADNFGAQNALKIISFIGILGIMCVVVLIPKIRS